MYWDTGDGEVFVCDLSDTQLVDAIILTWDTFNLDKPLCNYTESLALSYRRYEWERIDFFTGLLDEIKRRDMHKGKNDEYQRYLEHKFMAGVLNAV